MFRVLSFMVITYYGLNCFKIQSGEFVVVTDPFSKESGLTPPRFKADVVLISRRDDPFFNNAESLGGPASPKRVEADEPKIFNLPGEYETNGIFFQGLDLGDGSTAFIWKQENISLCHLGDFSQEKFPENKLESIDGVDILFIPADSPALINQIEPKAVIPMKFHIKGSSLKLSNLEGFFKEIGKKAESQEKLTIKKKELEGSGLKVFVLSTQ